MVNTIADEVIIDTITGYLTEADKKVLNAIYKTVIKTSEEVALPRSIKKVLHPHWESILRFE
jgi:hypothetical protein